VKQKSKWLKRAEAKFERDARREERKKRQAAEAEAKDAKLEDKVKHAFEVMRDLLLAEERFTRLAPKEYVSTGQKRVPPADLVGAPWPAAGDAPAWRHEPLNRVDLSLQSFYRGKIYASNAKGSYAPHPGAMSHDPRGRPPGKANEAVYQVAVGRVGIETIKPSLTWLGRPTVFGWALVDGRAPSWVRAADARLDEMVKADQHLVEGCLKKEEEDDRTGFGNAPGIGVVDGLDFEIAR
jgi:hypothetical protein